jgi:hypothetical protein
VGSSPQETVLAGYGCRLLVERRVADRRCRRGDVGRQRLVVRGIETGHRVTGGVLSDVAISLRHPDHRRGRPTHDLPDYRQRYAPFKQSRAARVTDIVPADADARATSRGFPGFF